MTKAEKAQRLVQFHLRRSYEQLCLATGNLQDALRIAKGQGYGIERTHSITTALARTQEAQRHAGRAVERDAESHALAVKLAVDKEVRDAEA